MPSAQRDKYSKHLSTIASAIEELEKLTDFTVELKPFDDKFIHLPFNVEKHGDVFDEHSYNLKFMTDAFDSVKYNQHVFAIEIKDKKNSTPRRKVPTSATASELWDTKLKPDSSINKTEKVSHFTRQISLLKLIILNC